MIFGPVEMSVELSRCQCVLWFCRDVIGSVEISVTCEVVSRPLKMAVDLLRGLLTCGDVSGPVKMSVNL